IAPGALISDPVPDGATFVSASAECVPTQGEEGQTIVGCSLGTLAVGDSASATITVTPAPGAVGDLTNTATAGANALDPASAYNPQRAPAPITRQADLEIAKTMEPAIAVPGQAVAFTLVATNHGPSDAKDVVVTDALPAGLTNVTLDDASSPA